MSLSYVPRSVIDTSMVLLGRKTNFKEADGSSIYIVNHQDAHTMYDVTIYEWQQSLGTCSGTWVLGYLVPEYQGYLSGYLGNWVPGT